MTEKEKQEWSELYEYVRKEVMNYDTNQKLSKQIVIRLKGLAEGKVMANKKLPSNATYSFEIILYTFKICKASIQNVCSTKNFIDDNAKFMYVSAIIDNNINDVYNRITNARQNTKKIEEVNTEIINHQGVEFNENNGNFDNKVNDRLKDLW